MVATVSRHSPAYGSGANNLSMSTDGRLRTMSDPSPGLVAISPSDVTVFDPPLRGIYVGVGGDVEVLALNDSVSIVFTAVPVGTILPVEAVKVMASSTTATNMVGLR